MARHARRQRRKQRASKLPLIAGIALVAGLGGVTINACSGPDTPVSDEAVATQDLQAPADDATQPAQSAPAEAANPAALPNSPLADLDFLSANDPAQPSLRYAYDLNEAGFALHLQLGDTPGAEGEPDLELAVGLQDLRRFDLPVKREGDHWLASLRQPWSAIGLDASPAQLRMALRARWHSPRFKQALRIERYFVEDSQSPSAALPDDVTLAHELDIEDYRQRLEDRRNQIIIAVDQPMDGRMSLVIEDQDGRRLRNLVSGADFSKGAQEILWDARDEDGVLVEPGSYQWRSIHHPGISAEFKMSYANGRYGKLQPFATNHGVFSDTCTNGELVFLSGSLAEGGYAAIAYDKSGTWQYGYNYPHGTPHKDAVVAADERFLYAVNVGPDADTAQERRHNPSWSGKHVTSLTRFDIQSRKVVRFKGKQDFHFVNSYDAALSDPSDIHGLVVKGDALYLASSSAGLMVFDKETGDERRRIAIDAIGPIALRGEELLVVSRGSVHALTGEKLGPQLCTPKDAQIVGLAALPDGGFLVSDRHAGQVIAYDKAGKETRRYGNSGGAYAGHYDPARLVLQDGISVFDGKLVVCEKRRQPKRFLQFDLRSGKVVDERYGNPPYGGSGGGFDTRDPKQWIGMGCQWDLDVERGEDTAVVTDVFSADGGHFGGAHNWAYRYRYVHQDSRTFIIGEGFIQTVSELMPDGSRRDLAALSTIASFDYGCNWRPPQALVDAIKAVGIEHTKDGDHRYRGVLWVDGNGDGDLQADEVQVSPEGTRFAGSRWGYNGHGLTLQMSMVKDKESYLLAFTPQGYNAIGAPRYPDIDRVVADATLVTGLPLKLEKGIVSEQLRSRFGTVVVNSDPWMLGIDTDGAVRWRYPNRWQGVHGSHKAPLPEQGVMQGNLMFLGKGELDEQSDVTVLNGNHGRYFWLTTDGFYLDETFRDVRMGGSRDDQWVGGEPFGGYFAKADDGRYFLLTGGDGYRIYQIHGLDQATRHEGQIEVTREQILAAERSKAREVAAQEPLLATMPAAPAIKIDGKLGEWKELPSVSWERMPGVGVTAWVSYDNAALYLAYKVSDNSPWRNKGPDWQSMFKTGDSVDFQIGTDPGAKATRRDPVPGDMRLLIAPDGDANMAVLYRHRLGGGKGNEVKFTSPWRTEVVDDVRRLSSAQIAVKNESWGYSVEAAIPLKDLGWQPQVGKTYKADFGVIYGDDEGTINVMRYYWANQATGLVNDVPGEIMLTPERWGDLKVGGK